MCLHFELLLTLSTLHLNRSVMPKQVYLLTVQEAHKEYGAVGTPALNAEACELANLPTCVSQLCQKLNLPPPKELYRPMFFKH